MAKDMRERFVDLNQISTAGRPLNGRRLFSDATDGGKLKTIDKNGVVVNVEDAVNPPLVYARIGSPATIVGAASMDGQDIVFDTVNDADPFGFISGNRKGFTIPVGYAGVYQASFVVQSGLGTYSNDWEIWIGRNGGNPEGGGIFPVKVRGTAPNQVGTAAGAGMPVFFNEGEFIVFQSVGEVADWNGASAALVKVGDS